MGAAATRIARALVVLLVVSVGGLLAMAGPAYGATDTCAAGCYLVKASKAITTGAADAAATISSALKTAKPGTRVHLPAGTYRVSTTLAVPAGVTLSGAGMDSTRLVLDRRSWKNFSYSYVVTPANGSTGATVRDLTVDGNRVAVDSVGADSAPAANQGGGIKAGSGWTVTRVRLSNLNYFKVWVKGVQGVTVSDSRFEDLGKGQSGGNDNIGGGDGARDVTITGNQFTEKSVGNSIDFVRAQGIRVIGNTISGTAAAPHNLYLEGVTDSEVRGNTLTASSISIQSNANYTSHTEVINPRNITVAANTVTGAASQGISVRYDIPKGTTLTGGANTIRDNTVQGAGVAGIIIFAAADGLVTSPDAIVGNRVDNAFSQGTPNWNCGYGVSSAAGIVVGAAVGTDVAANTVTESRAAGGTKVGIQYGLSSSRAVTAQTTSSAPNSVAGIAVAEQRV